MESTRDVEAVLANKTYDPNDEHKLQNPADIPSATTTDPSNPVDIPLNLPNTSTTSDKPDPTNAPNQARNQAPPQPKQFTLSMFETHSLLGTSAHSTVHAALDLTTTPPHPYALKTLPKAHLTRLQTENPTEYQQVQRQLDMPSTFSHRNILRSYGRFEDATNIYVVLELTQKGDLYKRLQLQRQDEKNGGGGGEGMGPGFPEKEAARYIAGVAAALRYLHDDARHVMLRDLKPEHVRLGLDGEVKISGFRWAVRAPPQRRRTVCGTLDYVAPEMLKSTDAGGDGDGEYGDAVDLWALGVLVYEFLVGEPPFRDWPEVTHRRIEGLDMRVPGFVGGEAGDLIRKLLVLDPEKRLSIDEVLKHPWITKYTGSEGNRSTLQDWELVEVEDRALEGKD
ncbi:Serine/threonine-protein kinase ark1 [Lachnellula arida]|uniref:Serine/threonine-protein kinase ark1 n=1 Tax=Lachnellula arida TaxID=1316785 RepID=A0A8T9BF25_9HELO|nr:Serine/threonine-protein kinase ark1 [Lachnellula arida]